MVTICTTEGMLQTKKLGKNRAFGQYISHNVCIYHNNALQRIEEFTITNLLKNLHPSLYDLQKHHKCQ